MQVPEYAGYATASKLFGFRTPQAAQAERAAQAGEDPQDIAAEYAAATKAAAAGANKGELATFSRMPFDPSASLCVPATQTACL